MLKIKGLGLLLLFVAQSVGTSHYLEADGCFTDMDMKIPVFNTKSDEVTGISEEDFTMVLAETEQVYGPVFEALGKTLQVNAYWTGKHTGPDGRKVDGDIVNASALQLGSTWHVNMFGGLARHEHATLDSFRAVVCHEIGHHIGGAPKIAGWWGSWASNEGQSDYFATFKCMKKMILEGQDAGLEVASPGISIYEAEELVLVDDKCSERFVQEEGRDEEGDVEDTKDTSYSACRRAALAGLSLGRLLGSKNSDVHVSLGTPDESVANKTNGNHPQAQCRADTYFAGSLCNLDFNSDLSDTDANTGTCNRDENFEYGLRPLCWYKPS